MARTNILQYILTRFAAKTFDPIKLHCSEILTILLQESAVNRGKVLELRVEESSGMEHILQVIYFHRKTVPEASDEAVA